MLKFLVVEDHPLVREGVCRLLLQFPQKVEIVEASDGDVALSILEQDDSFDLVLVDLAMPNLDGFALLDILRGRYPAIPVAVLSAYEDPPTVNRAIKNGASGFVSKSSSGEEILEALQDILDGQIVRPNKGGKEARLGMLPERKVANGKVRPQEIGLTERQAQVLALMIQGLPNREIGRQLGLTEGTVKVHATAVFKILGVNSRAEAMVAANHHRIDLDSTF